MKKEFKILSEFNVDTLTKDLSICVDEGWSIVGNMLATSTKSGVKYSILLSKEV